MSVILIQAREKLAPLVDNEIVTWGGRVRSACQGNDDMCISQPANASIEAVIRAIDCIARREACQRALEAANWACCDDELGTSTVAEVNRRLGSLGPISDWREVALLETLKERLGPWYALFRLMLESQKWVHHGVPNGGKYRAARVFDVEEWRV
jgi:hypothetical protein